MRKISFGENKDGWLSDDRQQVRRPAPVSSGKTYNHMYAPHPLTKDNVWTSLPSTKTKFLFEGLEEGALYYFKVTAVGARDQKSHSEVVSQYVLRRSMESAA